MKKIAQIEPQFGAEERDAVLEVMNSGFITEGKKTRQFEGAVAEFLSVPFAIVVNNATLALTIALKALGIGAGDEVIVPDFTFIATANAVCLAGAAPVFADVTPDAFVLDLADAEKRITSRTKAIVPVHLNGRAPKMQELLGLAGRHGLAVVEDAAQALGSGQGGRYLGTFGDAGAFSLGTTKIITSGQGGIIVTRHRDLHEQFVRIKDHGRMARAAEMHEIHGFNSKFTDLQAALGLAQFRRLPERMGKKRQLFAWYREFLGGVPGVTVPAIDLGESVPWFVDLLCEDREGLESHLSAAGIETRRFYRAIHSQPCFRIDARYPVAEEIASRGLWLPSSVNLTRPVVEFICEEISASCLAARTSAG
jgi:perosamine synthetase